MEALIDSLRTEQDKFDEKQRLKVLNRAHPHFTRDAANEIVIDLMASFRYSQFRSKAPTKASIFTTQ